ncbi:hypothetical protein LIX26_03190 [Leptospira borgpetersenii]|nr:hypothetical protein [Leptospira borgpetersenii]URD70536.1 hypothetical protein LIX26_03190 [Leptospira borgpetersenii]
MSFIELKSLTSIHDRESDRSENPAMQHGLNEEIGIYEKIEMLRCRLKRRARSSLCKQRLDSPFCPPSSVVCPLSSEVVGVNLSYSYANGFGAGVNIGTDNKTQLGGSIGLNYNAKSGSWGATAGLKVGLGGTDSQGNYSNWVDAGVHVNNIGRESQSQGVSANIRGQYNEKKGLNGSLGLSYDTASGYGATIGLTSSLGPVSVTPSWTVSEYGGLSSDVQYGFDRNLFNRTNNPDHSAANRNLLSDIFDGLSGLVSGVGRGAQSAWDGMAGAVGGLNGENLSNGWNAIKNALFGGGDDATLKPGPRPGTYVDEDGTVLVRDPKTGNLAPEWLVPNLQNAWSSKDILDAFDPIHQEAVGNVLTGKTLKSLVDRIQKQQVIIDELQGDEDLHKHANTPKDGDKAQEIANAESFVKENLKKAMNIIKEKGWKGLSESDIDSLGEAMGNVIHTLTDATSPSHEGFQEFDNHSWNKYFKALGHVSDERFYPMAGSLERSKLEGSIQWTFDIVTGKVKTPNKFFNPDSGFLNLPKKYYNSNLPTDAQLRYNVPYNISPFLL